MHIRCERCATLYELDEALLSPEGSQVQCSRCEHVFTARPPAAGVVREASLAPEAPVPPPPSEVEPRLETAAVALDASRPLSPDEEGVVGPVQEILPQRRAPRDASPAIYRATPPPASGPAVRSGPVLKRDPIGAFEARLRWSARVRWLVPAAAVGLVLLLVGVVLLVRSRPDPKAARSRAEALALVALDDGESFERALAAFDDAQRRAPKVRQVAADRALAQALRASALADEREALAARAAARAAERERLAREQPPGWQGADRAALADAQSLQRAGRAAEEKSKALSQAARTALEALERDLPGDLAVDRAGAVLDALSGDRDGALRHASAAHGAAADDPWIALATAIADAGATGERALATLPPLAASHPEILRGRYLLARAQAALGRRADARATVDALLAANPRHEGARRLREALAGTSAVPARGTGAVQPGGAPDPQGGGTAPPPARNAFAQDGPSPGSTERPPSGALPPRPSASTPADAARPSDAPAPQVRGRRRAAGALAPAALPDVAPASGLPQVSPPELRAPPPGMREPRSTDESERGG